MLAPLCMEAACTCTVSRSVAGSYSALQFRLLPKVAVNTVLPRPWVVP